MTQQKQNGKLIAIITMIFLFGIPITAYAIKLPKLPNIPKALDTEN